MVRVITNGSWDQGSLPVRVIPKSQKMLLKQTLRIIRYGSRESGAIQEKVQHSTLHIGVVAIEKGAFGSHSTLVG